MPLIEFCLTAKSACRDSQMIQSLYLNRYCYESDRNDTIGLDYKEKERKKKKSRKTFNRICVFNCFLYLSMYSTFTPEHRRPSLLFSTEFYLLTTYASGLYWMRVILLRLMCVCATKFRIELTIPSCSVKLGFAMLWSGTNNNFEMCHVYIKYCQRRIYQQLNWMADGICNHIDNDGKLKAQLIGCHKQQIETHKKCH